MTTTAAKNTLLTILAALTIGAFAGGCDDASAPPTLAATDDEAVPDGGAPPTSIMSPSSPANGVESCDGCIVPAGKFGMICVPCE